VEKPEDWEWSSYRHHATGLERAVEIESEWTARRRQQAGIRPNVRAGAWSNSRPSKAWTGHPRRVGHPAPRDGVGAWGRDRVGVDSAAAPAGRDSTQRSRWGGGPIPAQAELGRGTPVGWATRHSKNVGPGKDFSEFGNISREGGKICEEYLGLQEAFYLSRLISEPLFEFMRKRMEEADGVQRVPSPPLFQQKLREFHKNWDVYEVAAKLRDLS
jgi:hypothetical protein